MQDASIFDELNEECGIFGVYRHHQAAQFTYYGLHALQHRGQESAGIVSTAGKQFQVHRGTGLVTEVFDQKTIDRLTGDITIGHVRYSTDGGTGLINAQPLVFNYAGGELAIAANGSFVNAARIRKELEATGSIFQTTTDTEVIAHLIARSDCDRFEDAVIQAMSYLVGGYALIILTNDQLIALRDPHGLRPLSLAKLGDAYLFSSETCAFDIVGAQFVREVEPGEMLILDQGGFRSLRFASPAKKAVCSFEYIYFARPDSDIGGINVHTARKRLGQKLAEEAPVEADVVTGVPDSSISAAIGFAEATGIPYELGLIKNRYVGRTFIQPSQSLREQGVKMKLSAVSKVVKGKRVVMVDDSIVRGTTSRRIVQLLRDAGAMEIHVRISSPPVKYPCCYGIDTADQEQLIAANHTVKEIQKEIGADSLAFISEEGLVEAIGHLAEGPNKGHCLACFTGNYPTQLDTKPELEARV